MEEVTTTYMDTLRDYVLELGYTISYEEPHEQVLAIEHEEEGIVNLLLLVEEPIVVIEQFLFELTTSATNDMLRDLLILNGHFVHGALALVGNRIIFRDTLQLENLDLNELEGSINSLQLFLAENYNKLLEYAHKR